MIQRFRALPLPLRYAIYAVGLLAVFCVAIGVGAAAAILAGRQPVGGPTGSAGTGMLEGNGEETTGTPAPETTEAAPPVDDQYSGGVDSGAAFAHRATEENSRENYTTISDSRIDGQPNAVVLATVASDRGDPDTPSYGHNIGVWYISGVQKWAIFNQDLATVPPGATFEVQVPQEPTSFVHESDPLNSAENYTYLDDPLANGKPEAVLSVTQSWNPGGGAGVYNDHPIGVEYDEDAQSWRIYNRDGAPIPEGAAFNVAVSVDANDPAG